MRIAKNIKSFTDVIPNNVKLVAVSKTKSINLIESAYKAGQRDFGENKVQELVNKFENLPKDINWHMIGHLQRNKVKYIAPFIYLIQSVDSLRLLIEINKQGIKNNRVINVLVQMDISNDETKFGFSYQEFEELIKKNEKNNIIYRFNLYHYSFIFTTGLKSHRESHSFSFVFSSDEITMFRFKRNLIKSFFIFDNNPSNNTKASFLNSDKGSF